MLKEWTEKTINFLLLLPFGHDSTDFKLNTGNLSFGKSNSQLSAVGSRTTHGRLSVVTHGVCRQ